jgi:hypothetical protein
MDISNLRCLQYGPIKLILFMEGTHQTYIVYGRDSSLMGPYCKQRKFDVSMLYAIEVRCVHTVSNYG